MFRYTATRWQPCLALLIATCLCLPALAEPTDAGATDNEVTIRRDQWGVPHVYGPTDASVVYGYVYAQAQDNFWQIEDTIIQALGRYAEVVGEAGVAADYLNRALRVVSISKKEWQGLSVKSKALTQAATRALNQYLRDSGETPRLINQFEPWHFIAASRFSQYQLFVFNRAKLSNQEIAAQAQGQLASNHFEQGSLALAARNAVADAQAHAGSNSWAIAPNRTKSGKATLFINPHQPYFGPGQWYEGHLHSKQGLHFSGAGFFASPFPTIGHNQNLGWTHTVNEPDTVDVYELTVDSLTKPSTYLYDGEQKPINTWTDSLLVKTSQALVKRTYRFSRSHHGPIVAQRGDKLLAVRMAKFVEGGQLQQRYDMLRAKDLVQFKSALAQLATPMFNTMYADKDGNIYYAYYGAVPRRNTAYDWSKPVDGSISETEWQGYHPLEELPTLTNPASGYLQNCNGTPFLATADGQNLQPSNYPAYMAPEPDNNRSRMSRILLAGEQQFSYADIEKLTWDTYVLEADTTLPVLQQELAARDLSKEDTVQLKPALELLNSWDHRASVSSQATTIYFFWRSTQLQRGVNDPVEAFKQAMAHMHNVYGSVSVPWGEVNRLQRAHTSGTKGFDDSAVSLPIAGGPGNPFGTIFNFYARPSGGKKMYGIAGHSYVSLVEFTKTPKAKSIMVFGSSAQPDSPHYFDQSILFSQQKYKAAWFTTRDVKANTKQTLELKF